MGIIVPVSKITPEQLKTLYDGAKAKLLAVKPGEAIREIMPASDLGYTNEVWANTQVLAANTWTMEIDHELEEDEEIIILGVENRTDDPQVVGIKFQVGAGGTTTRDIVMLEKLHGEDIMIGYFKEPIPYKKKEHVYIRYYAKAGVIIGAEAIGLIGLMRKPYGEDISTPIPA